MILFRYIFNSLIFPTFLSASVLSMIMLMDNLYKFIPFLEVGGIKITFILQMIFFSLPTILTITLPIGVLMGVYTTIGRLSIDSEVIAIRSSGLSFSVIYKPVLIFSIFVGIITGACSVFFKPLSATALENLKFSLIKQQTEINIKDKQVNKFGNKLIYIFEKTAEDNFKGIVITDWYSPLSKSLIEAEEAKLEFNQENQEIIFHLYNGKIHFADKENEYDIVAFESFDFYLELPRLDMRNIESRFKKKKKLKRDYEMTYSELVDAINNVEDKDDYYEYGSELHSRFIPLFSCIALALIAIPIGITNPRRPGKFRLLKMILTIIIYNILHTQIFIIADRGAVSFYFMYFTPLVTIFFSYLYFIKRNNDYNSLREWIKI